MRRKRLLAIGTVTIAPVLLLAALLVIPLPEAPREGVSGNFLIRRVAIVDVEAGVLREEQDLLILDGRIAAVGTTGSIEMLESRVVIDGTGKFLMPGLWDMHTHSTKLSSQYQHPLFVANGITGVRDLWGCMSEPDSFFACIEDREQWNSALADHRLLAPRYIGQSSFQINGGDEVPAGFPEFFKARDAEEARQLVSYYAQAGADILKVYSEISPDAYVALADEAHKRGLFLDGHRPRRISFEELLAARQRSVEHARVFLQECYRGADDLRALADPSSAFTPDLLRRLIDEHDEERCRVLINQFAGSSTWWTPTLQTMRLGALAGNADYRADPRLRYVPYVLRKLMWEPDANSMAAEGTDAPGRNLHAEMYQLALQHVGQAHAAGGKLLAGTDAFDSYVFPGFSLHDELVALVAAGLSPAAALRTATIDAARFSGVEDDFGSIALGKTADVILLNADPLRDIRNTQQIAGLFFNGQYFDRSSLDDLLAFVEQRAGSVHSNLHLLWAAVRSPLQRVQFAD